MKRFIFLFIVCSINFLTNVSYVHSSTDSDGIQVNLGVDGCNNNSICEASIGETASSCPNDCSSSSSTGGGSNSPNFIFSIITSPDVNQAVVSFKTQSPVFTTLRWGTTNDYNTGTIRNTLFITDHVITLSLLTPATTYFFVIDAFDRDGRLVASHNGAFTTLPTVESIIILNPTNVRTNVNREGIMVRWTNPSDPNFNYVRVMRHKDRFHSSPFVGELIYEGTSQSVLDRNVEVGVSYYYTIFSRVTSGEFSSGVGLKTIFDYREDSPLILPVAPDSKSGLLSDFLILQNGKPARTLGGVDKVNNTDVIVIEDKIDTFDAFEDLWVEVTDPHGLNTKAYLFKYNPETKTHRADISPLRLQGVYTVRIYGFNKDHTVQLNEGFIEVEGVTPSQVVNTENINPFIWISGLSLLFVLILLIIKRFKL